MGINFIDKYSLLHFAVGIIFRFFNINFILSILIHILFEYIENTKHGIHFINKYLTWWPGGKDYSDSLLNSTGDTFFFALGWLVANTLYN